MTKGEKSHQQNQYKSLSSQAIKNIKAVFENLKNNKLRTLAIPVKKVCKCKC